MALVRPDASDRIVRVERKFEALRVEMFARLDGIIAKSEAPVRGFERKLMELSGRLDGVVEELPSLLQRISLVDARAVELQGKTQETWQRRLQEVEEQVQAASRVGHTASMADEGVKLLERRLRLLQSHAQQVAEAHNQRLDHVEHLLGVSSAAECLASLGGTARRLDQPPNREEPEVLFEVTTAAPMILSHDLECHAGVPCGNWTSVHPNSGRQACSPSTDALSDPPHSPPLGPIGNCVSTIWIDTPASHELHLKRC